VWLREVIAHGWCQEQMITEGQMNEEEQRLHDEFIDLLRDVETYLSPITAQLDAFLRFC